MQKKHPGTHTLDLTSGGQYPLCPYMCDLLHAHGWRGLLHAQDVVWGNSQMAAILAPAAPTAGTVKTVVHMWCPREHF